MVAIRIKNKNENKTKMKKEIISGTWFWKNWPPVGENSYKKLRSWNSHRLDR